MPVLEVLAFAFGAAIVGYTGFAALRTVVVPRASSTIINRIVFIGERKVFNLLAHERRTYAARDRVMALYGPVCLVSLPFVWISLMIIGFTFLFWAINVEPLRQAFILSGSSIFTLGFAVPHNLPVDLLVFLEAMIGLGLVALLISYLPSIYGAFARRERMVGLLEGRAGSPPSAVAMLRGTRRSARWAWSTTSCSKGGRSGSSTSRRVTSRSPRSCSSGLRSPSARGSPRPDVCSTARRSSSRPWTALEAHRHS